MSVDEVKTKLKALLKGIKNYDQDYIYDTSSFKKIVEDYDSVELDYKTLYIQNHNDYYRVVKEKLNQFKNSEHFKLIELLKKNTALKNMIKKELKLDVQLKKIKICNKSSEKSLFTKTRLICTCKYSMFEIIPQTFSNFNISIETLLEHVFSALMNESKEEFGFLETENKVLEFYNYLNNNLDKLDEIIKKIVLLIENKSLITIDFNKILKNLKAKYKKSEDFIRKFKAALKNEVAEIKKNNKELDIMFEYEL